mmetsp:Transcript_55092/g.120532  ORF Transcript_55092/g.120532 Transcript_55092/m.120532 type:complete len:885 (+) Transcript_55092:58-2712(+)|eukprot:CAMPEP_0206570866 /NCGR_PEP_ID=MMETSP0325_2-20121206/27292_1 /ASSEMBLY_ACC=CAM_ASM_000347 /TAXON_ID=2866 /ORGANISM="Crypthecodinium cohnii, Strain Seligo" /LENGTH=884 /DNA_ID=CAMNT_0054074735 /DNA_START=33 /DNA_END=2687 /DNA_ORIENTATION=-
MGRFDGRSLAFVVFFAVAALAQAAIAAIDAEAELELPLQQVVCGRGTLSARIKVPLLTVHSVEQAQASWARDLVALSETCKEPSSKACRGKAGDFADLHYGFQVEGQVVLLKPPQAVQKPFRRSRKGVVSWLVGAEADDDDDEFAEDSVGFVVNRTWKKVWFENAQVAVEPGQALAIGTVYFSNGTKGTEYKVDFSCGFVRDTSGEVRTNLQFFSEPFKVGYNKTTPKSDFTTDAVRKTIKNFGDSVISIGQRHKRGWDYQGRALEFLQTSFHFPPSFFDFSSTKDDDRRATESVVLFKPADAKGLQIRTTFDEVMSYFVATGKGKGIKDDPGLALQHWESFAFDIEGYILLTDYAWAMGEYSFRDGNGQKSPKAQFVFGFRKGPGIEVDGVMEGKLLIDIFHASFPHDGKASASRSDTSGGATVAGEPVTPEDLEEAQERWGKLLVQVGSGYRSAAEFVDTAYAYDLRPVLFKPAEATKVPFRLTRESAISFFGGRKNKSAMKKNGTEDWGFALKPWSLVSFENDEVLTFGDQAYAMGHVCYVGEQGGEQRLQFLAGWIRDPSGTLRMRLMHSSYPDPKAVAAAATIVAAEKKKSKVDRKSISVKDVTEFMSAFSSGLVALGKVSRNATALRSQTVDFVDKFYAFGEGPVLQKVTEASASTRFRMTRHGVISYLVGEDPFFPNDRGFARRPWSKVRFESKGIIISSERAKAMGIWYFTDPSGIEVPLEISHGLLRDFDGKLRLEVEFVSIPYTATMNSTWSTLPGDIEDELVNKVVKSEQFVVSNFWNIVAGIFVFLGIAVVLYFSWAWETHANSGLQMLNLEAARDVTNASNINRSRPNTGATLPPNYYAYQGSYQIGTGRYQSIGNKAGSAWPSAGHPGVS